MTDDGKSYNFFELFYSSIDILKEHDDEICLLKERIKVLEEQDHSTINAPSPIVKRYIVKRYIPRRQAEIDILECLSDGKKKTVEDFVGVCGTSRSNIYRALHGGGGTVKNPKGGLLVREPRLNWSKDHVGTQTHRYIFWLEDEIPSRLKTKPVKHPPLKIDFAKASETYRDESDLLGEFITDRCVMQGKVERRILLAEYKAWCNDVNEKPVSSKRFASLLRDRGVSERKEHGNRIWVGISLAGQGKIS